MSGAALSGDFALVLNLPCSVMGLGIMLLSIFCGVVESAAFADEKCCPQRSGTLYSAGRVLGLYRWSVPRW